MNSERSAHFARFRSLVTNNSLSVCSLDDLAFDSPSDVGSVRYRFIQFGMKLSLFIPKIFFQNHFHPTTTFIQNHFHPNYTFIPLQYATRHNNRWWESVSDFAGCPMWASLHSRSRHCPSHWEDWGCTALCSCSVLDQLGRLCSHGEQSATLRFAGPS